MPKRPSDVCIFCGLSSYFTKEHIFGKWLNKHVDVHYQTTSHTTSLFYTDPVTKRHFLKKIEKGKLNRNGSPHSHQLQVVCGKCNNSWLSSIQTNAKKNLIPLIKGNWVINSDIVSALISCATMITMELEFAQVETISITKKQRKQFMEELKPPGDWQIFVGLCDTPLAAGAFWHRGGKSDYIPPADLLEPFIKCDTQTTTFILGKIFVHTVSGLLATATKSNENADLLNMREFWPNSDLAYMPPPISSHDDVVKSATAIWGTLGVSTENHLGFVPPNW